jgi:hypothetical protein
MYELKRLFSRYDLGGKSEEAVDLYIPIGAVLLQLQDCPKNLAGIESNNMHVIGFDSYIQQSQHRTMTLFRFRR